MDAIQNQINTELISGYYTLSNFSIHLYHNMPNILEQQVKSRLNSAGRVHGCSKNLVPAGTKCSYRDVPGSIPGVGTTSMPK